MKNKVCLWFAKDNKNELITINNLNKDYNGKYYCPLCGSEVIPKAIESLEVSPHFAHIDRSKCTSETIIHWWLKNEMFKHNDKIFIDDNKIYIDTIDIEKEYNTTNGVYKPDITITSTKGEVIFFEINYTNKKNILKYIPIWKELGNKVVEINVHKYITDNGEFVCDNIFNSICMDLDYKNKVKLNSLCDKLELCNFDVDKLNSVKWFIESCFKYNLNIVDIEYIYNEFKAIYNMDDIEINKFICNVLWSSNCNVALRDIINYRYKNIIKNTNINNENINIKQHRLVYDRLFSNKIELECNYESILFEVDNCDLPLHIEDEYVKYTTEWCDKYSYDDIEFDDEIYNNKSLFDIIYNLVPTDKIYRSNKYNRSYIHCSELFDIFNKNRKFFLDIDKLIKENNLSIELDEDKDVCIFEYCCYNRDYVYKNNIYDFINKDISYFKYNIELWAKNNIIYDNIKNNINYKKMCSIYNVNISKKYGVINIKCNNNEFVLDKDNVVINKCNQIVKYKNVEDIIDIICNYTSMNMFYLSENQYEIIKKLKQIYEYTIYKKCIIELYGNIIYLKSGINTISEYEINNTTTYKDIESCFSNKLRKYLYGV